MRRSNFFDLPEFVVVKNHRVFPQYDTVTTINYMVKPWALSSENTFRGFIPIIDQFDNWGVNLDDVRFAALHVFKYDRDWGDDPRVTDFDAKMKPFVAMFKGDDDNSYYCRFETLEMAEEFAKTVEQVPPIEELFRFN